MCWLIWICTVRKSKKVHVLNKLPSLNEDIIIVRFVIFRLGEACSHIAALLFKINAASTLGLNTESKTSLKCIWNKFYRKQVNRNQAHLNILFFREKLRFSFSYKHIICHIWRCVESCQPSHLCRLPGVKCLKFSRQFSW